jgi:hypothetical protein
MLSFNLNNCVFHKKNCVLSKIKKKLMNKENEALTIKKYNFSYLV